MRCSCGQENPFSASECQRCGKPLLFGVDLMRLLVDGGFAAALLFVLGLVFLIDHGTATSSLPPDPWSLAPGPSPLAPGPSPLRLAVTPPEYDDMGRLLDTLGSGYRYTQIQFDDLLDVARLSQYDVVFVTCGYVPRGWVGRRLRSGQRDDGGIFSARPTIIAQLQRSLRPFVAEGGTLYVSDWHFNLVAFAFPEFIDRSKVGSGMAGNVTAEVIDPGLRRLLGESIELRFDKPAWRPAAFAGPQLTTYLAGTYRTSDGNEVTGPLLVRFPVGQGNVIFTSFHNEKQNSQTELQLLRYLVFTTVTAQTDSRVKATMIRGGFSPAQRNLLSASAQDQSLSQSYDCPGQRDLQFVLGFENRGAVLQLVVIGPDGRRFQHSGASTFTIDVPQAAQGTWQYTVTPAKVPYENFPFTLTVGEKP